MRKLRDGVVDLKAKGLNISLDDSCLCATCRGEKNATEGKPEWFNELKWTIAGRKIEVRPSDVVYYDLEMEQPIFPVSSADTRLHIKPGTTLALEAGSNTDTKDARMAVFFLTVRKLDSVEQK